MRRRARAAAEAAASAAASTAASTSSAGPNLATSGLPTAPTSSTLHLFHDSNWKSTAEELRKTIDKIKNKDKNKTTTNYKIDLHPTYTLPQTLTKIRQMTFHKTDTIVINILTNDARPTKYRRQKTTDETRLLQTDIHAHLTKYLPPHNIIFLESPPLLISPSTDIYPYNLATRHLAHQLGTRFAQTLVGESHLWTDGYHVQNKLRHLLLQSVAAAVADVNPHRHYGVARPPHGPFGPWVAPIGSGMLPPASFRVVASAQPRPVQFRPNPAHFPPLNNRNIR